MSILNKHSTIILFLTKNDIASAQLKIVLAEKGVNYEVFYENPNSPSKELLEYNPYGTTPTLVDNELVIFNTNIILEYLDERYPYPPLMPVYPIARAEVRLLMHRIDKDWFSILREAILAEDSTVQMNTINKLANQILEIAPIFKEEDFFKSSSFSLVDCCIAPLIWYLKYKYNYPFTGIKAKPINDYLKRVFEKESFEHLSISEDK